MKSGYAAREEFDHNRRRSTGQRYSGTLYKPDSSPPRNHVKGSDDSGSGERKVSGRVGHRDSSRNNDGDTGSGSGGMESQRRVSQAGSEEEEVVDGWPKWLVDNGPRAVLAGLVPKSVENYEKIDKVSFFFLVSVEDYASLTATHPLSKQNQALAAHLKNSRNLELKVNSHMNSDCHPEINN